MKYAVSGLLFLFGVNGPAFAAGPVPVPSPSPSAHAATMTFPILKTPNRPDPEEPMSINEFNLRAIEYWAKGDYAGGDGVSFGFKSNPKPWNQECARLAHAELKRALLMNKPEMKALREASDPQGGRGPSNIFLIVSDWTDNELDPDTRAGRVWHYKPNETYSTGGLIKWHAHVKKLPDGKMECDFPKAAELFAFARETRDAIVAASSGQGLPQSSTNTGSSGLVSPIDSGAPAPSSASDSASH